ncbi:MAG: hypothetical protein M1837_000085 [Sclerophora amabilis]|nr:MAG: hypothetical protein M1837_000085 [Sclerophora amabilis]
MQRYMGLTGKWLTVWVTVSCTTAMALFGYDQGVFGGIIVTSDFLNQMGIVDDANLQGTVTSIYDVGCFFGALSAFTLGERLGRKRSILLGTLVMMIGAVIQVASFDVPTIIVGRIVTGLGNGLNTASAPVWQAETSKASMRGRLVVLSMILNIAGFSLANWMTYGFSFLSGSISWRFPLAFQIVFGIVLFATVPWLPESPRWLIARGDDEKAAEILAALEGNGATIHHPLVVTEAKEIRYAVKLERESNVGWLNLLRGKTGEQSTCTVRRLILGAGTQAMQQLAGINVTSYYLPTVFIQSVGLEETLARLLAACNSVSYLLFSFIGIPNVERWGRRRLMMGGAAGQCFCYLIITIMIKVVQITPIGIETLGWKFYIIWTVFNASFVPIVYIFYPETAGRRLEDIDRLYREDSTLFVCKNKYAISPKRPLAYIEADEREVRRNSSVAAGLRKVESVDQSRFSQDEKV